MDANVTSCAVISPDGAVALAFIRALNNVRVMFLLVRDKCKIINAQRNAKYLWYEHHTLHVNFYVVIIVKSCLTFRIIH